MVRLSLNTFEVKFSFAELLAIKSNSLHDTGCLGLVHWYDPEG